jgi:hypothetical protein
MADVNVTFAADTSALDTAINDVKSKTQNLVPGGPGAGILTQLPAGLGGAQQETLLSKATAAAKAARDAGTEMRNFARAEDEVAESAGRAGINIGAMMERMAARLVIFEALRLAIQGVKYAFDEISKVQQAEIQFDAMSSSVAETTANFQSLRYGAHEAFAEIDKASAVKNALEDFGMSERKAILVTQDLDQWAKILGVDAVKLAEAMGATSAGLGNPTQWRLVTHMMGEQSEAGRQLVQTYIDLEKAQKNLVAEQSVVDQSMAEVTRATKEMVSDAERATDRQMSLFEKLAAGQAKKEAATGGPRISMPGFAPGAVTTAPEAPEDIIGRALQYGGMVGGMKVPQEAMAQYKAGLEEIARLEGTNTAIVQGQIRDKTLGIQDVMKYGRDATDDAMRNYDREDERRLRSERAQKTAGELAITGVKADITRVLPQAVTAPPPSAWEAWTKSAEGIQAAIARGIREAVTQPLMDSSKNIETNTANTAHAVQSLDQLFSGKHG